MLLILTDSIRFTDTRDVDVDHGRHDDHGIVAGHILHTGYGTVIRHDVHVTFGYHGDGPHHGASGAGYFCGDR
jgi:hypothetical protein